MLCATRVGPIDACQLPSGDQRLGAMNPVPRGLDVDSRAGSQLQPDLAPALERATRERPS